MTVACLFAQHPDRRVQPDRPPVRRNLTGVGELARLSPRSFLCHLAVLSGIPPPLSVTLRLPISLAPWLPIPLAPRLFLPVALRLDPGVHGQAHARDGKLGHGCRGRAHDRPVRPGHHQLQLRDRWPGPAVQPCFETLTERQPLGLTISPSGPCDAGSPPRRPRELRARIPTVAWTIRSERLPANGCGEVNRTASGQATAWQGCG
jgi:hypothetical protein